MKCSREKRGAATTEFLLSTLLIIPVLLYAIWIGEVFAVGAKAQEAEISAMWDATAYRVHDFDDGTDALDHLDAIASATQASVGGNLDDLDSTQDTGLSRRRFVGGWGTVQLRCQTLTARQLQSEDVPGFQMFRAIRTDEGRAADDTASRFLQQAGTVTCRARATYTAEFMPSWVLPQFSRREVMREVDRNGFVFFGVGGSEDGEAVSQGGDVRSGAYLLLDDWSVEEGNVNGDQAGTNAGGSRNPKFFHVAEAVAKLEGDTVTEEQLREVNEALLGNSNDPAKSAEFKFSLHLDLDEKRIFDPDQGERRPYLFPYEDGERPHDGDNGDELPSLHRVSLERVRNNYLGQRDPEFLGP